MRKALNKGIWAFCIGFAVGFSSCTTVKLDRSVSAADGNANTVFLSGCGQEALKGRVYCELRDTAQPTEQITMFVPSAACKRESCVQYQLIKLDGSYGLSGGVPKGQTKVSWSIAQIAGSDQPVGSPIDGEYQVVVRVYFIGPDGEEYQSVMKGLIRVVVLRADYQPIGCGDPNVAWEVKPFAKGSCKLQWTSALRAARCGDCREAST